MKRHETRGQAKEHSELATGAINLLKEMGLAKHVSLERLAGGNNNQVYKVTAGDRHVLLKSYFVHANDPRNRLDQEFSFLSYAWDQGIRSIPQPLAADRKRHMALYEFIDGAKLNEDDIGEETIKQAILFISALNKERQSPAALHLPFASEACFSVAEHINCVEQRLKRLFSLVPKDAVDMRAADFIKNRLQTGWVMLKRAILEKNATPDIDIDSVIDYHGRCLSPSDFGFHNALREANGNVRFIDFEYAGWDDPAKLICDFFCQPAVPIDKKFLPSFENEVGRLFDDAETLKERVRLLFPLFRIKWCCIMLNEFTLTGAFRRRYAQTAAATERREAQLAKAEAYLSDTLSYA